MLTVRKHAGHLPIYYGMGFCIVLRAETGHRGSEQGHVGIRRHGSGLDRIGVVQTKLGAVLNAKLRTTGFKLFVNICNQWKY